MVGFPATIACESPRSQPRAAMMAGSSLANSFARRSPRSGSDVETTSVSGDGRTGRNMIAHQLLRRLLAPVPLLAGGAIFAMGSWFANTPAATTNAGRPVMTTDAVSKVARDRGQSVVLLHSVERPPAVKGRDRRELFAGPIREGIGSGIVIDSSGLILTNAHVIESISEIHVRRPDGTDVPVTVVGSDPEADLALVRVSDPVGLLPAPLGDSDRLPAGSFVVALGSPLGLHHTVTVGVLSARGRQIDDSGVDFLQTDAAVNPGSSGGPLFDLSGEVIGVLTLLLSEGGENIGLNFAIPINTVKELLPALRENKSAHGWLGITTAGLTSAGARVFGLSRAADGVMVADVAVDGPAASAGVRPLDILLGLSGDSAAVAAADVNRRVWRMAPGKRVQLRLLRDGQQISLDVTLGQRSITKSR